MADDTEKLLRDGYSRGYSLCQRGTVDLSYETDGQGCPINGATPLALWVLTAITAGQARPRALAARVLRLI